MFIMESIFVLGEGDRAAFLQQMVQSFGCVYVCLWSYLPHPSNCLLALDGMFREVSDQPSSSSGSRASRLFDVYRESVNYIDSGRIPGLAFRRNIPYMELKLHDLQSLASNQLQLQFYQEAGIKAALFMGCARGEIELGWSNDLQVDLEMQMKNLFPIDFSRPAISPADPNQPPSSSSSSLRSLSVDSPEYSPLLFNIPTASYVNLEPSKEALIITNDNTLLEETPRISSSSSPLMMSTTRSSPHEQAIQALSQIRSVQFPTIETENAAMTNAILAVLSSPSTSSTNNSQPSSSAAHINLPNLTRNVTAFRRYREGLAPVANISRKNNMFERSLSFFRNLNMRRRHEFQLQGNRPTTTQLHHMISERRRREKLNESFHILRSLLPPGTKKDKASVLSSTTEYLSSLKSQVEELSRRNQMLESKLPLSAQRPEASTVDDHQRINVEILQVSSSTSDARFLDVRVRVRGERRSLLDLVIRIMELLKQSNVGLMSVESNTTMLESVTMHGVMMRLKIEGDEFDESAFREAVRRVVDDDVAD